MIKTEGLSYYYDRDKVFDFPDIDLQDGEHILILGSSGIGKTTLLHLLGGLMKPKAGKIIINDKDICSLSGGTLDRYRGDHIGIIFQQNHFIDSLSVLENLTIAQYLAGSKEDPKLCMSLLESLNVDHKAKSKISNLSQGERQRVAIARSLVNKPSIILADEPTSALDDQNCSDVVELLKEQAQKANATLLIVTHDSRLKSQMGKHIQLT